MIRVPFEFSAVCFLCLAFTGGLESHSPTFTTVLYNREVAALFKRKCLPCHDDDGMSMPLNSFARVQARTAEIKNAVLARRMPPWPAERGYGEFSNDIGLTTREFDFLISWIDGGTPSGTGIVPEPVYQDHSHSHEWELGRPDLLLRRAGESVRRAAGARGFDRVLIDTRLAEARWVRAVDYKPEDKRALRAAYFSVIQTNEYLGGWTPWQPSTQLPNGVAIRLPAGATIAVDTLSRGGSQGLKDQSSLALYFAPSAPDRRMTTERLQVEGRSMPARTPAQRLRGSRRLSRETTILALRPEMGPGATSLEIKARRPDGSAEVLLWIRQFERDWQTPYVFQQPLSLPAGSLIEATAYFENRSAEPLVPELVVVIAGFDTSTALPQPRLRAAQR